MPLSGQLKKMAFSLARPHAAGGQWHHTRGMDLCKWCPRFTVRSRWVLWWQYCESILCGCVFCLLSSCLWIYTEFVTNTCFYLGLSFPSNYVLNYIFFQLCSQLHIFLLQTPVEFYKNSKCLPFKKPKPRPWNKRTQIGRKYLQTSYLRDWSPDSTMSSYN